MAVLLGDVPLVRRDRRALRLKKTWAERVDLLKAIRGEVASVKSYWIQRNGPSSTLSEPFSLMSISRARTIPIHPHAPGGTVGNMTQWVSIHPLLQPGDYGIILLESSGRVTAGLTASICSTGRLRRNLPAVPKTVSSPGSGLIAAGRTGLRSRIFG